ncbi:unnamed protein product [Didymodactylos carnosus]|uniref:Oligopeptide transporter n=1 Tax=Didymodactylos carnosus TaxID=1234261 RepID=A0A814TIK1_9BILA|nr:unnamed protein product [Didymodactylos carnosus]CAF3925565.1 unnamed protein product [Didymodactylos carnosus]
MNRIPNDNDSYEIAITDNISSDDANVVNEYIDSAQASYEETGGIVSNKDDPDTLCVTFRSLFLGLSFNLLLATLNQYFIFKTVTYTFHYVLVLLLAYPMGKTMELCLPRKTLGSFSLNPGPFTIKEHALIFLMAYVASINVSAIDVVAIEYRINPRSNFVEGLFLVISSQVLGYGMAGIMRRFLVWPSEMIWPTILPYIALLRTLHEREPPLTHRWLKLTRLKFFILFSVGQMIYYWLPGYIMPVLSTFSWMCMINPNNRLLSQLTGHYGLGMGSFQFNWLSLTYGLPSPILVPRWAQINVLVSFVFFVWFLIPILYYTNVWDFKNMPLISLSLFFPNGKYYSPKIDISGTTEPFRMSVSNVLSIYFTFAFFPTLITHTIVFHGKDIWKQFRTSFKNRQNDVHCVLMSRYPEAPEWWYLILFLGSFIVAAVICRYGQYMPWYLLFLALPLSFACLLPVGILLSITNLSLNTTVLVAIIGSIIQHGDIVGASTFATFAFGTFNQALSLSVYLKFGHYMKLSPRSIFIIQLVMTIVAAISRFLMASYLSKHIPNLCNENKDWSCSNLLTTGTFYAVLVYSDPKKLFGQDSMYANMLYIILIGALLPILIWIIQWRYSKMKWLKYVHIPIMFMQVTLVGFLPADTFPSWLLLGFIFHTVIRMWWWNRYALLFTIAMDFGVQTSVFFLFFILKYQSINFPSWWGTQEVCPLSNANYYGNFPTY